MRSTFFGIETQRRALLTQRKMMDVIGHNVANASTPGYTRQSVVLTSTSPTPYPGTSKLYGAGQIGTGVITQEVRRIRDVFVDKQLRSGLNDSAQLQVQLNTLQQIENVFMEPAANEGLNNAMSSFFDSWQELSKRPENFAARNQVISTGQNMVDVINNIDQVLRDIRVDLNGQLIKDVEIVNGTLHQISALTHEIAKVYTHGDSPNDLLDKRDLLLDDLAEYVNYDVIDSEFPGGIAISIGGRELLRNDHVYELGTEPAWDHPSQNTQTPYMRDVSQADYQMLAQFSKGELKGILNSRDEILVNVQNSFQEMVSTIVNSYNNVHSSGMGITQQNYSVVSNSTSDINEASNYVGIDPVDTQLFSVGDILYISDPRKTDPTLDGNTSNAVTVTVTSIDKTTGRLYFDSSRNMDKGQETVSLAPTTTSFNVALGAEIRKVSVDKFNFFQTNDVLSRTMIGDANPLYTSQMTSTISLPDNVTLNTTIREIETMLGVTIVDSTAVNSRLMLDNETYTDNLTKNMTLGDVFNRISKAYPTGSDPIQIELDSVNHKVIIKGNSETALEELGGLNGSSNNLFRVLGFEGYNITGFQLQSGAELSSTLNELGISSGWLQIDNTLIQLDDTTISLDAALVKINDALVASTSTKKTNMFFDAASGRLKIVSDHIFATAVPSTAAYPSTSPAVASNMLMNAGLLRDSGDPTFSAIQQLASVTTSDIGARIAINKQLLTDINRLATSITYSGIPGDNSVALQMASLKNQYIMGDSSKGSLMTPTMTMDDYYNNLIGEIGVDTQTTMINSDASAAYLDYYQNKREEVSGVSIDEEMTKLIEAQHAFQAAARMVNTVDEMLDRIINGTGLAGR